MFECGASAEAGVVVFLIADGGLYLSQRLNTPYYSGGWQCAGGGIEPGETDLTAAIRETKEETGLDFPVWRFEYWGSDDQAEAPFGKKFVLHIWAVYLRDGEIPLNTEPEKHSDWEFVPKSEVLARDVLPGIRSQIVRTKYFEYDTTGGGNS